MKNSALPVIVCLLALLAAPAGLNAQPAQSANDELSRTIQAQDAALFEAYNTCALEKFGAFFTDDIEFYHDQGGLSVGRQALVDAIRKNICGKVTRELVPGTLEVYPMKGYGAVEIGVHRFHHPSDPKEADGEAKFIHLWQNKDGVWKITRVISFDHHSLAK